MARLGSWIHCTEARELSYGEGSGQIMDCSPAQPSLFFFCNSSDLLQMHGKISTITYLIKFPHF
jgi:hypothetical protein